MRTITKLFLVAGVVFYTSCSNNASTETPAEDSAAVEEVEATSFSIDKEFPQLVSYLHAQDSSFATDKFEGGELETNNTLPETKIDTTQLAPFRPYLVYNSNKSMAIDPVSYNYVISTKKGKTVMEHGGPDTEVALVDLQNNTRKRLLFLGASGTVLQVKWEGDSTVDIVGVEEVDQGKIRPSIWRYHLPTGKMELYQYADSITANIKDYTEQKLNRP